MRTEHRTTADEHDLHHRDAYPRFNRAGTARRIRERGHRHDRRQMRRALRNFDPETD